jgi:hypothetical protein
LVVVVLNFVLTVALISQLGAAQAKVDKYDAIITQAQILFIQAQPKVQHYIGEFDHFADQARKLSDYANRILHGSVPDLINDIAQSKWSTLGNNVTSFSGSIRKAFDYTQLGSYNEEINKISAIVESVSKIVQKINPAWTLPAPQPTDDQGFLNVFSYIVDWTNEQADKTKWKNTAVTCVDLIDAALPIDWSGKYVWHNGQRYGYYDWNSWINSNLPQVRDTCAYFAQMKDAVNGTEFDQ